MARKPKSKRAENIGDFAGPDADRENMEKLAAAAKEANARTSHSTGPTDDALQRCANAIEVALIEIDNAASVMGKARTDLAVARKTAKTELGGKSWVDTVVDAVKLKRQAAKGGMGEIVTEHRQMGRVLRLLDTPLGTQFNLFALAPEEAPTPGTQKDETALQNEATLAGEHAGLNGEPKANNPYQGKPGSPQWFGWNNGWQVGADKLTDSFKTGALPIASDAAAAH